MIGIGGASRHRPSHTTGHTGPYHGGSTELCLGGDIEAGQTEGVEGVVPQGLLDRRVS
jgi:hypothetical protein